MFRKLEKGRKISSSSGLMLWNGIDKDMLGSVSLTMNKKRAKMHVRKY